jgi:hypothetical protein
MTFRTLERWAADRRERPVFSVAVRLIVAEHLKVKGYLK